MKEAAMMAPSAGNQQPWHFIIISNRENHKEVW
jgi:nitroreductase